MNYPQETERIISLIHQFEKKETGKKIIFLVISPFVFTKEILEKLKRGRLARHLITSGNTICIMKKNKYVISVKKSSIAAIPKPQEGWIWITLFIEDTLVTKLNSLPGVPSRYPSLK